MPISWFKALMKGWVGQEIILDSFGLGIKTFKLSKKLLLCIEVVLCLFNRFVGSRFKCSNFDWVLES